ncbi:MAG: cobalt-precorrin-5B (C(1))-methyltransferase [Pseudomonadota bacterium]
MTRATGDLRTGFTTGTCAAAAAKAAAARLLLGHWPRPVSVLLPRGGAPAFDLALAEDGAGWARAGIRKDAGDDPDVTHGAMVVAHVSAGASGAGITMRAGDGVGVVTKPGLPLPVGAPAINPVPQRMIRAALGEICARAGRPADLEVEISIPGGAALAAQTWNPRLGIAGGLSILGTTGIVKPYSCAAWIASIHRGIDVARASGAAHVAGATGSTSERAAQVALGLPDHAMLDMGDFAGGMLKYLRAHPVPRVTVAGGFGKLTKLAQGSLDLHSSRSQVDFARLADWAPAAVRQRVAGANTAAEALSMADPSLAARVAGEAAKRARAVLGDAPVTVDVMIVDRKGAIAAWTAS